jgi:tetratricopeptide (TPR) repeat protein
MPSESTDTSESQIPRLTRTKRSFFILFSVVVVPTVFLWGLEVVLRLSDYGVSSEFFVPIEGQRAYTANPNFARQFFPPALARLPQPIRVSFDKPDNVTRIVVLGGSAAMGEPEPTFSFSRVLDVMLSRQYPDRTFEVINTGMATINSHVVRLIANECHKIKPDVVLIYMGNNEVVGPFGAGTVFGSYSPNLALIRLGITLRSFRIGQLIENVGRSTMGSSQVVAEGQGMSMFRDQYVHANDPRLQKVYSHFQDNLEDIIETLQTDGVKVIVSTVGANLVDHAPFASVFGDELGADSPEKWGSLFASGISLAQEEQVEEAIASLQAANRVDSTHAELHFRLGQLYLANGDREAARRHWILARDFDALRFRVDSRENGIIRETADRMGVRLVDAEARLGKEDRSGLGVPGQDLFHEHVHLTFKGNYLVGRAFAEELITQLGLPYREAPESVRGSSGPGRADILPSIDDCERDLALTDYDRYRLFASVAGLMRRAPFTNQFDYLARRKSVYQRLNKLRAAGTSADALERAEQVYRKAVRLRADDRALRQNFAKFLQETSELVEATGEWQRLLDSNPDTPAWRLALATSLSDQGAHQAALHEYDALRRMVPGLVLPHIQIGYEYVSTGQIGEAVHVLLEALEMNPGSIVARLNVTSLLEDVGQSDAADTMIDAGLAIVREQVDPHGEADLLVGRSELYARRSQFADARGDLDEALILYRTARDLESAARTILAQARISRQEGRLDDAMSLLRGGRKYAADYEMRELEAQFVMESALIRMDTGEMGAARPLVAEALALFGSLSDRHPAIGRLDAMLSVLSKGE